MKAFAYFTAREGRRRDTLNIALADGRQVTFNDDDNQQGYDPGTGRSVDQGGVGWQMWDGLAASIGQGRNGLLAYDIAPLYQNLVFEIPGKIKLVQDGAVENQGNGFYKIAFNAVEIT